MAKRKPKKGNVKKIVILLFFLIALVAGLYVLPRKTSFINRAAFNCITLRSASTCNTTLGCTWSTNASCENFGFLNCPSPNCQKKYATRNCSGLLEPNCKILEREGCKPNYVGNFCQGKTQGNVAFCRLLGQTLCNSNSTKCTWIPKKYVGCTGTYLVRTCQQVVGQPAPAACLGCTVTCSPNSVTCNADRTQVTKCKSNGCGQAPSTTCPVGTRCFLKDAYHPSTGCYAR